MSFLKLITVLGGNILDFLRVIFTDKYKQKKQELNAQIKKIEREQEHEMKWDMMQAYNARGSWKDEFWTILLAIPVIMCFIPGLETYAVKGFKNLEEVPEWYMISLAVAIASAFGFRKMVEFMVVKR